MKMEDVWKKVGDAFGWISKSFGYKQARTKTKHSDLDIDLDSKLECVCEEPEKVCSNITYGLLMAHKFLAKSYG